MTQDNKTYRKLKKLFRIPDSLQDFISNDYNLLINEINLMLERISISGNFQSEMRDSVEIAAGTTVRLTHKLGSIPKYRIILRQSGGGTITDGVFSNKYIELTNTGGSDTVVSVAILKE